MTSLEKLKAASNLSDLAKIFGFTPKGLSYVLYKLEDEKKYTTFDIPKKTGGTRTINAPIKQLALLQKRLGQLLYECVAEMQEDNAWLWKASHGFNRGKTIVSNAAIHRRRRFVFNVDIEDFFGAINFGRVRGFFINDRAFELSAPVATVLAQIACYENRLPQGSPCSPVISNLIGNILDLRLIALAKKARCTYTRYADDLTFSTNQNQFPGAIAKQRADGVWVPGRKLNREITRFDFSLNPSKTRMALHRSRQSVTGLVVNEKPNIDQSYYRSVRAMCNSLFHTGQYYRPPPSEEEIEIIEALNPLEGMLSHIYFVKARRDRDHKINKEAGFVPPSAPIELYRKFLFFKHFVVLDKPLIITEGISDITYLKAAIKSLIKSFPTLAEEKENKINLLVKFLSPSGTARNILNLGHGASGQVTLISTYQNRFKKYKHKPLKHPVIILCDNDDGPKKVFAKAREKCGKPVSISTTEPFYFLGDNLYLVKVPEGAPPINRDIEDLFPQSWLSIKLGGKPFDKKKEHGDSSAYGKVVFAEKVVRPNADKINFSSFSDLLSRIDACIVHYNTLRASGSSAMTGVAVTIGP